LFCETSFGVVIPALIGASASNPDLVKHARAYLEERRTAMEPIIQRAIARQELPADTDPKTYLEIVIAPLYYRHLISGDDIDETYINAIVQSTIC
jgi:hypothetical protein